MKVLAYVRYKQYKRSVGVEYFLAEPFEVSLTA